jgi:hypothetical protein
VRLDDRARDREAEARAALVASDARLMPAVEDARDLVGGEAAARVLDGNLEIGRGRRVRR